MVDSRITAFHTEVEKILSHLHHEFSKLQTGRANSSLVESVEVEAYGTRQELRAVASVSIADARTIVIQAWDKSILGAVERALQAASLGSNPVNDGVVIRITLPPMTEERRQQLVKLVNKLSEDGRITVRKVRQDIQEEIKAEKDEDVRETLLEELQKAVEEANGQIAAAAAKKEEEVMKV